MGFLVQTFAALRSLRAGPLQGPLPLTADRVAAWLDGGMSTTSGLAISPQNALMISAVYACVRVKSEDVSKLPLILYEQQGRTREPALDHPLYPILHRTPNPFMTAMQFRETMQAHVELWGNAYASIERDPATSRILGLWPLQPNRMDKPVLAADGRLLYNYHLPSGEPRLLTQDEVFHLRGLGSDGIMGYSPVALHKETFGWTQAMREYNSAFYGNAANPSGVLQVDNKLSTEAKDRLRQSWNAAHQGLSNAHRVAVLEDGVKWQQMGIQPVDAQYLETLQFMVDDIARIFRVPPHKIASLLHATFSNIEEENLAYVTDTLQSMCERWEEQIYKDLLTPAEQQRYYPKHNLNALLRGKTLERFQAYQLAIQQGILSPNDVLELEDRNPFEGGDVHLQQANMIPFGTPPPEPQPAPAPVRTMRVISRTATGYELREVPDAE